MKTLIINGSPRTQGNTAALIEELKRHLEGEVVELSAFRSRIAPCVDCRACWTTARCVVRDEMDVVYADDFDNVVVASPVYFSTVPGQVLSLFSRMQPWHCAMFFLKQPLVQHRKKAAVILTGGGKGNCEGAFHHLRAFFRMVNAHGFREHMALSLKTDTIPAWEDEAAMESVREIARWLSGDEPA
ncbi:MAG: flavodoxin family protein [Clostridia bacterium]|nr:flavodoxin family protein [Clostridia bacterium]